MVTLTTSATLLAPREMTKGAARSNRSTLTFKLRDFDADILSSAIWLFIKANACGAKQLRLDLKASFGLIDRAGPCAARRAIA